MTVYPFSGSALVMYLDSRLAELILYLAPSLARTGAAAARTGRLRRQYRRYSLVEMGRIGSLGVAIPVARRFGHGAASVSSSVTRSFFLY